MVTLVDVSPADIPTEREGRRGRVSYPLLKMFLERNVKCSKITDPPKNPAYLRSVLYAYIRSHSLPIKVFQTGGDMYLMRLDLDKDGQPIPDWKPDSPDNENPTEGAAGHLRDIAVEPITGDVAARRFTEERKQFTK